MDNSYLDVLQKLFKVSVYDYLHASIPYPLFYFIVINILYSGTAEAAAHFQWVARSVPLARRSGSVMPLSSA
jgi:hypothetical protein